MKSLSIFPLLIGGFPYAGLGIYPETKFNLNKSNNQKALESANQKIAEAKRIRLERKAKRRAICNNLG